MVGSIGVRLALIKPGKLQIRATGRVRLPHPPPKLEGEHASQSVVPNSLRWKIPPASVQACRFRYVVLRSRSLQLLVRWRCSLLV